MSEELRILNNRLELTETNLRQAQIELEKAESKSNIKNEDTPMTDVTVPTPKIKEVMPVMNRFTVSIYIKIMFLK